MNDMVRKLNSLGEHDARVGSEASLKLALMRVKAQTQNDNSRFHQAVGKAWPGQAEWESGSAASRKPVSGAAVAF
jgi:hypothetical protein